MTPAIHHDLVWTDLPAAVTRSKLYIKGGAILIPEFPGVQAVNLLESEAFRVRAAAWRNDFAGPDVTEERGGSPSRAFSAANAETAQWTIFSAPAMLTALAVACGMEAVPTGGGTYSYYERPGDYLALHRDILTCDLTVVTCVRDTGPPLAGGALLTYPEYINRPLHLARLAGRAAGIPASLQRGESVALLGGVVPHEVTPMHSGQERIVSVMCFRVQGVS